MALVIEYGLDWLDWHPTGTDLERGLPQDQS
jgi:hypothetical protein